MGHGFLGSLRLSLGFLTVLPVGRAGDDDAAAWRWATAWFPLVGLVVGALLYAGMVLPLPPLARAALVLALWIGATGGLHEDGWMDCLDAAFAPVTRDRRLEILKDPHMGAHGVTGGIVLLLLRFGALTTVPAAAVLVAPVVGRWAMVLSLALATPARSDGLGVRFAAEPQPLVATVLAGAVLAGLTLVTSPTRVLSAWTLGALTGWAWGWFLARRFGGLTGDGHGAVGLVAELAALWAFVPLSGGAPWHH